MKGELALVTGATGHIGRAVGLALREAGADIVLHGRDAGRAARLREETGAEVLAGDLTTPEAIMAIEARIAEAGRLNTLVLSSGFYSRSVEAEMLHRQMMANVIAPYALLRSLLPFLIEVEGQIVFINSTQGLNAAPDVGQFAATQHAMRAIADSLRGEVNEHGVRVLSIYLGRTASERQAAIFEMEGRDYRPELLIQPGDVAHAVLAMLRLPRTAEATQLMLRPMRKS